MRYNNKIKGQLSLIYFAVLGLVIYLCCAPLLILFWLLSFVFPSVMNAYYFVMVMGIRFYIWVSPLKYKLHELGELSAINQKECMIISNHRSHMDMFLFLAQVYKVRAAANSYIAQVPLLGQVLRMSGHFILEAGNVEAYKKALVNISDAFKKHDKVLFFAEGTRCETGFVGVQKFRMTPFQIARESNVSIIPVVIWGTDKVWPKGILGMDFSQEISIKALPAVSAASFPDSASLSRHVRTLMENELKGMAL